MSFCGLQLRVLSRSLSLNKASPLGLLGSVSTISECLIEPRRPEQDMRLVGEHGEALALGRRQRAHRLEREGGGLDGTDDDLLAGGECLGELPTLAAALALDRLDHAGGALEIEQRLLKLAVDHPAVGHDDHGRGPRTKRARSCRSIS
jgi:hypothetical protein